MLREERFEFILKQLTQEKMLTYDTLSAALNVSGDTVRRDIDILHNNGLLSKVRGGAVPRARNPLTFQDRSVHLQKEKDIIALKAQQFIKNDQTLFMDGGTTNCSVAACFPSDIRLQIITNNLALVPIIERYRHIKLIVLGGVYDADLAATIGTVTCNEVGRYIADVYFMGTCAIDRQLGLSAVVQGDAEVKRAMLLAARKTVALANHERFRRSEPFRVCALDELAVLITDMPSDQEDLDSFRNMEMKLV